MSQGLPPELLGSPAGPPPVLPPETALLELPFNGLAWQDFERLCARLAGAESDVLETSLYGVPGQDQGGIDIYSRLHEGGYCVYQCKKYETLYPSHVREAVTRFIEGPWAERAKTLVFCTSHSCVVTERRDVIEEQAARLRALDPELRLIVWDAERLSDVLQSQPALVRLFFGRDALRRFDPVAYEAERANSVEAALDRWRAESFPAPRIVDLSGAPQKLRRAYDALSPRGRALIGDVIGEDPEAALVANLIETPPSTLRAAGADEWRVFACEAERCGEWGSAARAWQEVAGRSVDDDSRVKALGDAAAAAGIAGERALRSTLEEKAQLIDSSHPRVILMSLSEEMPPDEQLAALEGLQSDDPAIECLIQNHRVLAHLRKGDLESARSSLDASLELAPDSPTGRMLKVNFAVQRGRLDHIAHRPLRGDELRNATSEAAEVRKTLLGQRRYGEASRLLMLGADAYQLLDDDGEAARLLSGVTDEELAEVDAPEVLGDAALRTLDLSLALRVTERAAPSDAIERIRATARVETGNQAQREEALRTLERLAMDGGPEADMAGFARLHAALTSPHVPWSERAHDRLLLEHHREATMLRALFLARRANDPDQACALLEAEGDAPWALVWLMRLGLVGKRPPEATARAADRVMATGPSQAVRVECGQAYARAGEFPRAQEVLVSVAHDPGAPTAARCEAYDLLVRISGLEKNDWSEAHAFLMEWIDLAPGDDRANTWRPTVANRRQSGSHSSSA